VQSLRQFVSAAGGGGTAHRREVKDLAVSKDVALLLSASADSTLAVWNVDTDRQMTTLNGHRDEVAHLSLSSRGLVTAETEFHVSTFFDFWLYKTLERKKKNFKHVVKTSNSLIETCITYQ